MRQKIRIFWKKRHAPLKDRHSGFRIKEPSKRPNLANDKHQQRNPHEARGNDCK